jgi:predicted AAA+ superfamily ATPase
VSAIARDAATARTTVSGYLEVLEDTLLVTRLPAYESKARVRERKHPKLYWVDAGLVRAVKRQLGPLTAEERGPLLEGWIYMLLRAYGEYRDLYDELYYWSPADGAVEVDFLLRRKRELMAVEVKAATRFSPALLRGLRAADDLARVSRRVLVYTGTRSLVTEDGIDVWPVERFVQALEANELWS